MTAPPKCRLCGSSHWGRDPHRWTEQGDSRADPVRSKNPAAPRSFAPPSADLVAYLKEVKAKRAAYMRRYRAAQKDKAGQ